MEDCKTISFVSFKGGSGRSVTLANVAYQLAKQGHRVGIIDADIDAGGQHVIFDLPDHINRTPIQLHLMSSRVRKSYMENAGLELGETLNEDSVYKISRDTRSDSLRDTLDEGDIFLIHAAPDANLTNRVDTGSDMYFYFSQLTDHFIEGLRLDYLFVDCRSGISNLSLPGLTYADTTVICMRWGAQHRYGTEKFLRWYDAWRKRIGLETTTHLVASSISNEDLSRQNIGLFCSNNLNGVEPSGHSTIPFSSELQSNDKIITANEDNSLTSAYQALGDALR